MEHNIKVLLTNRNEVLRNMCATELKGFGCQVISIINDGKVLLDKVITELPDVILIDTLMLNIDVISVLQAVKKINFQHQPIILVMSTEDNGDLISTLMKSGASHYIQLPTDLTLLVHRIDQLMNVPFVERMSNSQSLASNNVKSTMYTLEMFITILRDFGIPENVIRYVLSKRKLDDDK
jgi:DNA-binding response OmpR family regulator